MTCTLAACRVCTGCAHANHGRCRRWVTCPTTGEQHRCSCPCDTPPTTEEMAATWTRESEPGCTQHLTRARHRDGEVWVEYRILHPEWRSDGLGSAAWEHFLATHTR